MILNEYSSVFTEENVTGYTELRHWSCDVLDHKQITKEEVLSDLKCIKAVESPGPDQIHPWILWGTREEIAKVLGEIFASSLVAGDVPEG